MDKENQNAELLQDLSKAASCISCVYSRQYIGSTVGLLVPLFKELEKNRKQISEDTINALHLFKQALDMAKNLAQLMRYQCKLYMVLNREEINKEFENISRHFTSALFDISYHKLNIPSDAKEQAGRAHSQFARLNEMIDAPDLELYEDMSCVYNQSNDVDTDDGTLSKLCRKLQFLGVTDIKRESQALKKVMNMKKVMNFPGDGNLEESEKKMSVLLKKLENFLESRTVPYDFRCPISLELMRDPVITCTGKTYERASIEKWLREGYKKCPVTQETLSSTSLISNCALLRLITKWHDINGTEKFGKSLSKLTFDNMEQESGRGVPAEFVCCLSEIQQLGNCQRSTKLMKDPVIICTGQTYERASIEKWLKAGHITCPLTKSYISSTSLTPNDALYCLITIYREVNGLEPLKRSSSSDQGMVVSTDYAEGVGLAILLSKLTSVEFEDQRSAAEELCYLAKHSYNSLIISETGDILIPLLVRLLFSSDTDTQKHAITTLRELSFGERDSRHRIISSNAVPGILYVLENGSMEARENAAFTFWSLSTLNEFGMTLGESGAIPALVKQLRDGSRWEKIASAGALSELCKYEVNQGLAISAGVVPMLLGELTESSMVDEALDVMKLLVRHPDGKAAIRDCKPLPVLLELLKIGLPRNKEIVLAILCQMQSHLALDDTDLPEAKQLEQVLMDLHIAEDTISDKAETHFKILLFPFI